MTSIQQSHHMVTQSHSGMNASGHNLDNNLDALLDDLQTSVSRPGNSLALVPQHNGPLLNGGGFPGPAPHIALPPGATGYREVTTTVTQETNGVPMTSRDYQIEYLNPANSVTVVDERASSPSAELLKSNQQNSYKAETYRYKYSDTREEHGQRRGTVPVSAGDQDNRITYSSTETTNLNRNLNELDSLLKELNTGPQHQQHSTTTRRTEVVRTMDASPSRGYSVPETRQRSLSANRDVYNESSSSTQMRPSRAHSPGVTPGGTPRVPHRNNVNVQREVNTIEQRSHTSRRDSPSNRDRSVELSPTLRRRTPSPASEFRPVNFSSYPISPSKDTNNSTTTRTVVNKYTTNYGTTGRRTPTPTSFDDAQPYRSPSPVSFPQKRSPSPVRKNANTLNRSDSGRTLTYQVSPNAPPLSDPNSPTVITYKYTSHSSQHSKYPGGQSYSPEDREPLMPRPFPTPSPVPQGEQVPPKKLEELMASFQDNRQRTIYNEYTHAREVDRERQAVELQRSPSFERNIRPSNVKATQMYSTQHTYQNQQSLHNQHNHPVNEVVPPPTPPAHQPLAKSVAGPPVYYPPGVELFAKKEEAYIEQENAGSKGKMKGKGKMKYKYERSEKSKEKSSSGVAAVPVCLPLCCAMPCVIM